MSLSEDAKNIVNESQYQEKLKAIMMSAEKLLNKAGIEPTEIQWTILINHLNEMIRRSTEQEKLPEIDVKLFDEVSEVSLELAEVIVNEIANLSVDEKYVLSIHFETAKNN
ncbi:PRD domain-containing protein [uncultured Vagococcus sp.]|uniref:PRD domain-containing protein n=1 Tax=uncultured Vagococcus sp. TaxID=189676 RepID=UPI0028D22679|nr:PRD domain-containing protein [uncultured Vagococcus sp.]